MFVLGRVFPHLLIAFVRFWLSSAPARKKCCLCAGSGSLLAHVCSGILIQLLG